MKEKAHYQFSERLENPLPISAPTKHWCKLVTNDQTMNNYTEPMSCTLSAESYLQNCRQELKTKNSSYRSIWCLYVPLVLTKKKERKKKKRKKKKKGEKKKKKKKEKKEKKKKKNKASTRFFISTDMILSVTILTLLAFTDHTSMPLEIETMHNFQENCWSTFWSCPKYQAKSYQVTKTKPCHSIWLVTLLTLYILTETGNTKRCFGCH